MSTDINVEGIDWAEAGKHLKINLDTKEIKKLKLQDVVSTRKKSGGKTPGNTTAEVMGKLFHEEDE